MSIRIEVFSAPGCGKCSQAKQRLAEVAAEYEGIDWREINILEDLDHAVQMGILSTPAIAIDGKLIINGTPSLRWLREQIEQRLGAGP